MIPDGLAIGSIAFSGAIFVRAGNLILDQTAFENNTASGSIGKNSGR